ncbi:MAG: FliO/MopB family protein [Geminicoccaceae bacterium]|nr:FliO/MopB family protein [Geminicoccaceae bacterium]
MAVDWLDILRSLAALAFVAGLVLLAASAGRRFLPRLQARLATADRRLAVIETLPLDARNRLVLVRADEKEHLLVLSSGAPVVVATNGTAVVDGRAGSAT